MIRWPSEAAADRHYTWCHAKISGDRNYFKRRGVLLPSLSRDKGRNGAPLEKGRSAIIFEAMPDPSAFQGEPTGRRPRILSLLSDGARWVQAGLGPKPACYRLFMLVLLTSMLVSVSPKAQQRGASGADDHRFDIGIIIDNRPLPRSEAAKADVNMLLGMLDRQMFIEHIMVFERPTIDVVCDVFGCPEDIENANPFPPLIWQITRENEARLFVYYIGDGRLEGLKRELLFRRVEDEASNAVIAFPVEWLHDMLADARPASSVLMLDTSFSPRPLPCADEDPLLITDALESVRRNYRNVMRNHWNRTDNLELGATTPVQPPHCDRFDQVLDDVRQPLFTKYLLKAIVDGEADKEPFGDEDRLIELGELADYLDDRIKRATRFQWGRLQNVRAVGPRGKALAALDGRTLSLENRDIIARRNRPPEPDDIQQPATALPSASPEPGVGQAETGSRKWEAACRDDPTATGCHPCVIDPDGNACAERCQEDERFSLCAPNLSSNTEEGAGLKADISRIGQKKVDVITIEDETGRRLKAETGERSTVCLWMADNVAPLVQRIRGITESSCRWAIDRSEVELGPFAQIFTPIAWRLGRESAQDAVSCLLDCGSPADATGTAASKMSVGEEDVAAEGSEPSVALQIGTPHVPQSTVDPRSLGAFNRQICDDLEEPLPPYIGLPRWMPGTLIISEALRASYGCPPQPREPELPTPFAVAIEAPEALVAQASADRELSRWPPSTAGVDPLTLDTDQGSGNLDSGARIADSPPTGTDRPTPQPEDLPEETLSIEKQFDRTVSKVRWLQSALTVDNRHPGPVDGIIGAKTEEAIRSWRRDNKRENRTGPLTEQEFQEIIREFGERFGQIEGRAQSF